VPIFLLSELYPEKYQMHVEWNILLQKPNSLEVTQLNKEKLGKDDKSTCLFYYTPINLKIG
jgi:hypothetical protein